MQKLSKHDSFVEDLYLKVKGEYDLILRQVPLVSKKGRMVGEIDLMGVRGERVDIFEVKCSFRIVKARKQLAKIRKYVGDEAAYYFYCGSSQQIEYIESSN